MAVTNNQHLAGHDALQSNGLPSNGAVPVLPTRIEERGAVSYWVGLIVVATVARVAIAFLFLDSMPLVADALSYSEQARKLLSSFPGPTAYFWPPGTPYLLAAVYAIFNDSLVVSKAVAIVISVMNVVLIAAFGMQVLKSVRAARLAGWIACFYPPDLLMAGQTLSYPLTMLCLLLMACCLVAGFRTAKLRYFVFAGLALGFGSLTRPSTLAVTVVVPIAYVLFRRLDSSISRQGRWQLPAALVTFVVAAAVCVLPVMSHNFKHGAGWTLSTNNEWNFFLGNNRYTPLYKTGHFGQRSLQQLEPEVGAYFRGFLNRPDARSAMMKEAVQYIREHPFITMWRTLNRTRAFWGFDHTMARQIQYFYGFGNLRLVPLLVAEAGGYCLVMLSILAALICARDQLQAATTAFVLLLVLGYQWPHSLAFASSVYHVPVMGLLLPFAAASVEKWRTSKSTSLWPRGNATLWLAFALFSLVQIEYGYYLLSLAPA